MLDGDQPRHVEQSADVIPSALDEGASLPVSGLAGDRGEAGLGDEVMPATLLDRLFHRCHIVNIRGNSYRMRRHAELSKAIRPLGSRINPDTTVPEADSSGPVESRATAPLRVATLPPRGGSRSVTFFDVPRCDTFDVQTGVEGGGTTVAEVIERLVAAPIALRNSQRLAAAMRSTRLPCVRTLDAFNFSFPHTVKREQIDALHELGFLERGGERRVPRPARGRQDGPGDELGHHRGPAPVATLSSAGAVPRSVTFSMSQDVTFSMSI